ncbi:MAG TPA: glycosyltransferase, partial [Solirubrobacteraceae bacterium]|nr:glycosyltransferase [Solirubrobacteraceae bacterium]
PEPVAAAAGADAQTPTPVFVVGAERSGASALAAALAQHPAIALSLHGGWLGPLAGALHGLRDATLDEDPATFGVCTPATEAFAAAFAPAAAGLAAGDRPARFWVDGAWQLARDVPALAAMFPDAKFIHVVRDVHSAIRALTDPPLGAAGATGGTQIPARLRTRTSEREAVERWTQTVEGCLDARRRLGAERMLTVSFADLVADPDATTRRCLEFVGEDPAPECLRPLRELRTLVDGAPLQPDVDPELWKRALEVDGEARSVASVRSVRARGRDRRDGRAPRIVMVTDHFPKFSETFFVRKFLGLLRRGWDVHVVCQRSSDEQWAFFPELRAQIRHEGRLHVARENLDQRVVELRPDIVHFGYGTLAHGRTQIRAAAGCRTVTSFRGYDLNSFRLDDPGCFDEVFRSTDVVHAVSEAMWRRAQERGCPSDQPHRVITDAVDVSWFEPPAQRTGSVLGTPARPLRILTVGRLHWKKGHDHALHATRLLVERGVEVEHRFVGEGEYREPTEFAIADLGLTGRVELLGARGAEEVRELLGWADVLLHPSLTEAFGVAVIEAQAMGLPVVCSDAGGLPENVEHDVSGFVVERRDAGAMADRLAQLAAQPALRERMGGAARRRAETVLSDTHQLDQFEALYEELLEQAALEVERTAAGDLTAAGDSAVAQLEQELALLEARQEALRLALWRRQVVDAVRSFATGTLPRGAHVLVVSRGDEEVVDLPAHRAQHFPQAPDGGYAGHHPADSSEAIAQLEALRARGAEYLLVPATSDWWLEHYGAFTAHLEREHTRLPATGELFVAFALAAAAAPAPPAAARDNQAVHA